MMGLTPARRVAAVRAYGVPRPRGPIDLDLSAGQSYAAGDSGEAPQRTRRYPDASPLAARIAADVGIEMDRVLITAGADDALDRVCRVMLEEGRNALITDPTFEMIPRYVALAGGATRAVSWPGDQLPVDRLIEASDQDTALVLIASPNNPTGAVASAEDFRALHDALPTALIVADLAYVDFADIDPTRELLTLPRLVALRTISKGWALPGLRVGYALGRAEVIGWMRRVGGPFPVSSESLATAEGAFEAGPARLQETVRLVRTTRGHLEELLHRRGVETQRSQANFVTVASERAAWVHDALASLGIATRFFAGAPDRLRITIPTIDRDVHRLRSALEAALEPEAVLFDLDGVLADVSESYREAIRRTAARFGASVTPAVIAARKAQGNANDDWQLTTDLIRAAGRDANLAEVTAEFERIYQGADGVSGLRERESLTVAREWLRRLSERFPMAIVTGRPRIDAERFLTKHGVSKAFSVLIAREDAPLKPSPDPVRLALARLGVTRACMLGDTPDDIVAARLAGVVPVGVILESGASEALSMHDALNAAGAARVITSPTELTSWLS